MFMQIFSTSRYKFVVRKRHLLRFVSLVVYNLFLHCGQGRRKQGKNWVNCTLSSNNYKTRKAGDSWFPLKVSRQKHCVRSVPTII